MCKNYKTIPFMLGCLQGFVILTMIYVWRFRAFNFSYAINPRYSIVWESYSKVKTYHSRYWTIRDFQSYNDTAFFSHTISVSHVIMEDCPADWRHEVIRYDANGLPAAQVCRSRDGNGHWICAEGWERLLEDPYCVKVSTTADTDKNVGSFKAQTSACLLVADNLNLFFYQLPGTYVDVSQTDFRVLHENGKSDQHFLDQYHKFTFIMHPCSRLIKLWEDISNPGSNVSFTSFLNSRLLPWKPLLLSDGIHFKTQTEMLFDNEGYFRLDQCLVMESWNKSLAELMKRTNFGPKNLQLFEIISSNSRKCSHMYTQETWLKMTNSYAMDFCVFQYSTNIHRTDIIPSLDLTLQTLATRYKLCRQKTTEVHNSVSLNQLPFVLSNPCTIHTYYEPAYDDPINLITNQNVLRVWEKAWTSAGWQTRVLKESHAMFHPDYEDLNKKFQSLPTVNSKRYEVACFIRYLAMAVVGGGWMSDYDTLPLHFPSCSEIPFNGSFTLWSGYVPCLVSANKTDYTRIAHLIADVGLQWQAHPNHFIDEISGLPQVSDMKAFSLLIDQGRVRNYEIIIEKEDLSNGGFACKKSSFLETHNSGILPRGMPSLPWGIHISHNFMGCIKDRNITLWPGSSWAEEALNPSPSFREKLMKYVYNIYLRKCYLPLTSLR